MMAEYKPILNGNGGKTLYLLRATDKEKNSLFSQSAGIKRNQMSPLPAGLKTEMSTGSHCRQITKNIL